MTEQEIREYLSSNGVEVWEKMWQHSGDITSNSFFGIELPNGKMLHCTRKNKNVEEIKAIMKFVNENK